MGTPYHVSNSVSKLFFQNTASAEYEALSVIAKLLAHPQRTLLSSFVQQAADRELAARFFLSEIHRQDAAAVLEFLADWTSLIKKVRPVVGYDLEASLRQTIWRRDGGQCCISKDYEAYQDGANLLCAYIIPPTLLCDDEMAENGKLYRIFAAFIGQLPLQSLRSMLDEQPGSSKQDRSNQLLSLSPAMFEHFKNGRLSLLESTPSTTTDTDQYLAKVNEFIPSISVGRFLSVNLNNKASGLASLPNPQLLKVHSQLADALAWLEVSEYMRQADDESRNKRTDRTPSPTPDDPAIETLWGQWCYQSISQIIRYLWTRTPASFRAFAYMRLASVASSLYGDTGSARVHQLPFNYYLRIEPSTRAPRHEAEFEALRLVEKYTTIPAPRGVDTFQHSNHSFLLMTAISGTRIGPMLATMTDEQLDAVASSLREYTSELRRIPKRTGSDFQICNPLGGGILDWRIADSRTKELRFRDEAGFHEHLTEGLFLNENALEQVSISHGVKHNIVFTHADLNMKNILVDKRGKIAGIVDWECAGWYPEYWEYTKAHFTVRVSIRWLADVIHQVFPTYNDELQVENMLTSMRPSW
ncbi:kinase-like domain-containing protein [Lophiotrema nucula]|uniref:Kinase-like domain-containing protein n=1 Tax=Lophiotrema nucula TaxID=690887 RepID=A0A6A5YTU5_9PLEO|nr:kinase-like domain-containing protein [Lophiotrema nucula]